MTAVDTRLTSTGKAFIAMRAERDELAAQLDAIRAELTHQQRTLAAGDPRTTLVAETALSAVRRAGWPPAPITAREAGTR